MTTMTRAAFLTIPAGQLASAVLGSYANFIEYLNALSTAVDTNTSGLSGKAARCANSFG